MILARFIEKLMSQNPNIAAAPIVITRQVRKPRPGHCRRDGRPALGQVPVLRVQPIIVKMPISETSGEVSHFIRRRAFPEFAADRQDKVQE